MLVAAAGWLGWQELWAHGGDRPLAWRDLTDRTLAEPPRAELRVFGSRMDLRDGLTEGGRSATVPPIDFSQREAILVAAGPRSSGAYELEVVAVTEERRRIVVSVHERTPSLARPGAARLTFPFRLITIERRDKDVTLDWRGRP
ncbi:MAG TPA: protease complex subunit PrcB family protein [Gaiellaceae bacterium]|nr:protease complex subunit PrcB family protein [Gaiellaceae bacterium]